MERGALGSDFGDVLAAARAGSPVAFERLFRLLGPAVAGYLRAQGAQDPDDLAGDVFMRAFTGLAGFEGDEARFRSWIFTIAHHRLIDDRRSRARRPRPVDGGEVPEPVDPGPGPEDAALRAIGDDWVERALATLTPDQRDVLLLRIVADLTVEQVAITLTRPAAAVKALQRRGLATLRRTLDRTGVPL